MTRIEHVGDATLYLGSAYETRLTLGWFDGEVMNLQYEFDNSGGGAFRRACGATDQIVAQGFDQGFDHWVINPLLSGSIVVFCHNDQPPTLLTYIDGLFHRFVVNFWAKANPSPHRNKHYLATPSPSSMRGTAVPTRLPTITTCTGASRRVQCRQRASVTRPSSPTR